MKKSTLPHYYVIDKIFISYDDAMEYCESQKLHYDFIVKTKYYLPQDDEITANIFKEVNSPIWTVELYTASNKYLRCFYAKTKKEAIERCKANNYRV